MEHPAVAGEVIPQKIWQARSTLNFLKRNENAVMAEEVVYLAHEQVTRVLSKTFEVLSRDAHYITIAARNILAERVSGKVYQEEEVFKAEISINDQLERINEFFDRRIQQSEQKFLASGRDPDKVPHRTKGYQAFCTTQAATEFIQVLKKADIYLVLLEYLWITGELSDTPSEAIRAKLNSEREVRNHLLSIPRKSTSQFNIIRRICSGVMDQRKAERQEQSVRDKKKHEDEKKQVLTTMQEEMANIAVAA